MGRSKLQVVVFSVLMFQCIPYAFSQQASVSPSVLNFAPQVVNLVSPGSQPQTITLTNTGNSDLIVSSVLASGGYKQTNNCSILSSQQTCTIAVTFAPGTVETINGAITINDNTPSSPQVVSLTGKGTAHAVLSPGMVKFGTVAIGATSQPQAVTLTAAPNSSFSINQISTSGEYAQTNNCPATLQDGQHCTIQVVFHPTVNASVRGALAVSTDGGGEYPVTAFGGPRGRRFRECRLPGVSATCQPQFRQQRGARYRGQRQGTDAYEYEQQHFPQHSECVPGGLSECGRGFSDVFDQFQYMQRTSVSRKPMQNRYYIQHRVYGTVS